MQKIHLQDTWDVDKDSPRLQVIIGLPLNYWVALWAVSARAKCEGEGSEDGAPSGAVGGRRGCLYVSRGLCTRRAAWKRSCMRRPQRNDPCGILSRSASIFTDERLHSKGLVNCHRPARRSAQAWPTSYTRKLFTFFKREYKIETIRWCLFRAGPQITPACPLDYKRAQRSKINPANHQPRILPRP